MNIYIVYDIIGIHCMEIIKIEIITIKNDW